MVVYPPLGVKAYSVTTAVGLSPPDGALRCLITVEDIDIRFRDDSTDPTSTVGLLIKKDNLPFPYEGDLSLFKMVSTNTAAKVHIAFYGKKNENAV